MSDKDPEECFELLDFITSTHRAAVHTELYSTLSNYFPSDSPTPYFHLIQLLKTKINEKDDGVVDEKGSEEEINNNLIERLTCQEGWYDLEFLVDLNGIKGAKDKRFPCQPFIYHPELEEFFDVQQDDVIPPPTSEPIINVEVNELHRLTGYPLILTLNPIPMVVSPSLQTSFSSFPLPVTVSKPVISSELVRFLLDVALKVLNSLKIYHVPILVPLNNSNCQDLIINYEGVVLNPPISNSILVNGSNGKNRLNQNKMNGIGCKVSISKHIIKPMAFGDLKKVTEYYLELEHRHFKDKINEHPLGNKVYLSGEYWYNINISPDLKWGKTKALYFQPHPSPIDHDTKPRRNSLLNSVGITGSFENLMSLYSQPSLTDLPYKILPELSWGPTCDPLKGLELSASFPQSEFSSDLELTPNIASTLFLGARFNSFHQEWALLTVTLKSAIDQCPDAETGLMFPMDKDELSFNYRRNSFNSMTSVSKGSYQFSSIEPEPDLVNYVTTQLFDQPTYIPITPMPLRKGGGPPKPTPPGQLAWNLLSSSGVPYRSFLWQMVAHSLSATSIPEDSKCHDLTQFVKSVWGEVAKRVRHHWENKILIPNLNTTADITSEKKDVEVDLRFNLVHQKLSMLNYCINRQILTPTTSSTTTRSFEQTPTAHPMEQMISPKSVTRSLLTSSLLTHSLRSRDGIRTSPSPIEKQDPHVDSFKLGDEFKGSPSNALQGSPELVSPPSSYPKHSIEVPRQRHASCHLEPSPHSNHSYRPNSHLRDISLTGENSFVQLAHPSSSISSYNSLSELALPPFSPHPPTNGHSFDDKDHGNKILPEGRLKKLGDVMLLDGDDFVYIPITQDPGVMTEDMLLDQAQLFERLGTSELGAKRRAQLQGAQLLSDMEAFKAANPKCCLSDFVRWHSPRDWLSNDKNNHQKGKLSQRMGNPNNLWMELWNKAKPIPVSLQKPLFDSLTEGEKALHFIENLSVYELYTYLLPTIFLIGYDTLYHALPIDTIYQLPPIMDSLMDLCYQIVTFNWDNSEIESNLFEILLDRFKITELMLGRTISLLKKLGNRFELISSLILLNRVKIKDGIDREIITNLLFNQSNKSLQFKPNLARFEPSLASPTSSLPKPYRREIILDNQPIDDQSSFNLKRLDKWFKCYLDLKLDKLIKVDIFEDT